VFSPAPGWGAARETASEKIEKRGERK